MKTTFASRGRSDWSVIERKSVLCCMHWTQIYSAAWMVFSLVVSAPLNKYIRPRVCLGGQLDTRKTSQVAYVSSDFLKVTPGL